MPLKHIIFIKNLYNVNGGPTHTHKMCQIQLSFFVVECLWWFGSFNTPNFIQPLKEYGNEHFIM